MPRVRETHPHMQNSFSVWLLTEEITGRPGLLGFVDFEFAGLKSWPVSISKLPLFIRPLIHWLINCSCCEVRSSSNFL